MLQENTAQGGIPVQPEQGIDMNMNASKQSIGQRLRSTRLELGISQCNFANELMTAPNHICQIERGRCVPGSKLLRRMRVRFGIDINWLLSGQGNTEPANQLKCEIDALVNNYRRADAHTQALLISTTRFLAENRIRRKDRDAGQE